MNRLFDALERLMRPQRHAVAVVDQRVARNACLLVIRAAKSAVDDNQFAATLDRVLIGDTDEGQRKRTEIDDLVALTEAYGNGLIREKME